MLDDNLSRYKKVGTSNCIYGSVYPNNSVFKSNSRTIPQEQRLTELYTLVEKLNHGLNPFEKFELKPEGIQYVALSKREIMQRLNELARIQGFNRGEDEGSARVSFERVDGKLVMLVNGERYRA